MGSIFAFFSINNVINKSNHKTINGSWHVYEKMDLSANLFQRAVIARIGLFALQEKEVLYFEASSDSEGRPLESQYDYELSGIDLDARYWSFTIYGDDFFLIPNLENKYNINSSNIVTHKRDTINGLTHYKINISSKEKRINWIPSGEKQQQLYLTLRLYNPAPEVYNNIKSLALPVIKRIKKENEVL